MAIYSLGLATTNHTISEPLVSLVAASDNAARLLYFEHVNSAAGGSATRLGIGIASSSGTPGGATAYSPLPWNPSDAAAKSVFYLDYNTTYPGVPSTYFRQSCCALAQQSGQAWSFPRGLLVAASATLVIWNITTPASSYVNFDISE